jgi:hypothetical protein
MYVEGLHTQKRMYHKLEIFSCSSLGQINEPQMRCNRLLNMPWQLKSAWKSHCSAITALRRCNHKQCRAPQLYSWASCRWVDAGKCFSAAPGSDAGTSHTSEETISIKMKDKALVDLSSGAPRGRKWKAVKRWVVFSDLHLGVRTLNVCIDVLRTVHREAALRDAGIIFLGARQHM